MPDLTRLFQRIKDELKESSLVINDRYIGMATFIIHCVFPKDIVAAFIEKPGPPPAGHDSGDISKPEPSSILPTGKAVPGTGQPGAAGTRKGNIDA